MGKILGKSGAVTALARDHGPAMKSQHSRAVSSWGIMIAAHWGSGFELLLLTCGLSTQDNYTFAQPGIQKKVKALEELVSRIDGR